MLAGTEHPGRRDAIEAVAKAQEEDVKARGAGRFQGLSELWRNLQSAAMSPEMKNQKLMEHHLKALANDITKEEAFRKELIAKINQPPKAA